MLRAFDDDFVNAVTGFGVPSNGWESVGDHANSPARAIRRRAGAANRLNLVRRLVFVALAKWTVSVVRRGPRALRVPLAGPPAPERSGRCDQRRGRAGAGGMIRSWLRRLQISALRTAATSAPLSSRGKSAGRASRYFCAAPVLNTTTRSSATMSPRLTSVSRQSKHTAVSGQTLTPSAALAQCAHSAMRTSWPEIALPPLARIASSIMKSPTAAGTRKPLATVLAFSTRVAKHRRH